MPRQSNRTGLYATTRMNVLNWTAVFGHVVSFFYILSKSIRLGDVTYNLTHNVVRYIEPSDLVADPEKLGYVKIHESFGGTNLFVAVEKTNITISLTAMICSFFFLSAFFQTFFKSSESRYIEYTFSGSLLGTVIALQVGIFDCSLLLLCYVTLATCMLCGYLADILLQIEIQKDQCNTMSMQGNQCKTMPKAAPDGRIYHFHTLQDDRGVSQEVWGFPYQTQGERKINPKWFAHLIGWVPYLAFLVVVLGAYSTLASENDPPSFVVWIVFTELTAFTLFGFTQVAHLAGWASDETINLAYIIQSLFSKMFLGWFLAAELFSPKE